MKYLIALIILISGSLCFPIHAGEVQYWDLIPQSCLDKETPVYQYTATVLIARQTDSNTEVLFRIQDGQDENRFTKTWIKNSLDQSHPLNQLSMGDQVIFMIDSLNPKHITIADFLSTFDPFSVDATWSFSNTKLRRILVDCQRN